MPARSICIASGKGGTGKSLVTASLAYLSGQKRRTLLFDGDLGVGNAHILQDAHPEHTMADVVEERVELCDAVHSCGAQLDLIPGGSGFSSLAALSPYALELVARGLMSLEPSYERLFVDGAAGLSEQTLRMACASDLVLVVTTPDVTAMTDAYALLKVMHRRRPGADPLLVVNRCVSREEGRSVAERVCGVARRYIGWSPRLLAILPDDRAAFHSSQKRCPVVVGEPSSALARALVELHQSLGRELEGCGRRGLGRGLLKLSQVGGGGGWS